ncbi:hypothetical protein NEOKW01_0595 [Nematocida sp. AWRm80]|nr:hypothetical protein NEOKW01_0595 [Nematocida sp. AWRm80]
MTIIDLPRLPKLVVPLFREKRTEEKKSKRQKKQSKTDTSDENTIIKSLPFKPEKKHLCKYFVKNACIRGNNCTFSHDLSKFPCKLFHIKKNCRRKNCQFSHEPISEEEIKQLVSDGWELEKEEKEEVFVSPFL